MGAVHRIREHVRTGDFLHSAVEFLLALAFLALGITLVTGQPSIGNWAPSLPLWVLFELAVAFILGLFHFVTTEDERLPLWSRLLFVLTLSSYILFVLRFAWMAVVPLLAAKTLSLWLHGALGAEAFAYRVLKGCYIVFSLVAGLLAFAVLDALGLWPKGEHPWPLAFLIALYYLGLGFWQAVLEALKRMPGGPAEAGLA